MAATDADRPEKNNENIAGMSHDKEERANQIETRFAENFLTGEQWVHRVSTVLGLPLNWL